MAAQKSVTPIQTTYRTAHIPRLEPVFIQMSIVAVSDTHTFTRHQHEHYEIVYVVRGMYRATLNGTPLTLPPGRILIVKPGDWHEDFCDRGLKYVTLAFQLLPSSTERRSLSIFADAITPDGQGFADPDGTFAALVDRITKEASAVDAVAAHVGRALALEFFWRAVRAFPATSLSPSFVSLAFATGFSAKVNDLFQRSITRQLSIPDMAEALSMSESAFTHKCTDIIGESPKKAFMRFKMERAQLLLMHSEMSVGEVSDYLGFANQYHFSRAFKRFHGKAPRDVR
ncbi:MAG: AraC family transcriptional regulator [Spirochaetota bacterium]